MFNSGKPELEFEKLKTKNGPKTAFRTKVPGGWFVYLEIYSGQHSSFFYPDPNHEWDGNSLS